MIFSSILKNIIIKIKAKIMTECTLADLKIFDKGEVLRIAIKGDMRRRLLDMGLIKGTCFQVVRVAPLGDPIEIFLKGFYLSLRKEEAEHIIVQKFGSIEDGRSLCKGDSDA